MSYFKGQNPLNSISPEATPQSPPGEFTQLPQTLKLDSSGPTSKGTREKEKEKDKREGRERKGEAR